MSRWRAILGIEPERTKPTVVTEPLDSGTSVPFVGSVPCNEMSRTVRRRGGAEGGPADVIALGHERLVRAKIEAHAALLAARGYAFDERRLRARARRELGEALGYRSLTAARAALGSEADVRASLHLDGWFAALEDGGDLLAPEGTP